MLTVDTCKISWTLRLTCLLYFLFIGQSVAVSCSGNQYMPFDSCLQVTPMTRCPPTACSKTGIASWNGCSETFEKAAPCLQVFYYIFKAKITSKQKKKCLSDLKMTNICILLAAKKLGFRCKGLFFYSQTKIMF